MTTTTYDWRQLVTDTAQGWLSDLATRTCHCPAGCGYHYLANTAPEHQTYRAFMGACEYWDIPAWTALAWVNQKVGQP